MGLDKIRQAVLTEATAEATRIIEDAQQKVAVALAARKNQIDQEAERHYSFETQAITEEYQRKLIQYKGTLDKQLLARRNMVLYDIFRKTSEIILGWPEDKYADFMGPLIEKVTVKSGGYLRVHKDELNIFTKVLSNMNAHRDPDIKISLDESNFLKERGGFIYIGDQYEVDQTLKAILKDAEHETLHLMAKELFSE